MGTLTYLEIEKKTYLEVRTYEGNMFCMTKTPNSIPVPFGLLVKKYNDKYPTSFSITMHYALMSEKDVITKLCLRSFSNTYISNITTQSTGCSKIGYTLHISKKMQNVSDIINITR